MKTVKIMASVALSVLMLTGCVENFDINMGDSENSLSANELYDIVCKELSDKSSEFTIKGKIDIEDTKKALENVRTEHPEFFWINGYSISSVVFKTEVSIDVMNDYSPEELTAMSDELNAAAEKIAAAVPHDADDFGKIIFVHDNIVYNTVYDKEAAAVGGNGLWGTSYGCLVNGKAVCQGYAEGFQYIMGLLDIPCGTVTGMAWASDPYSSNGGEKESISHAWNYVKLNGKYYWIDVTWDDPDESKVVGEPIMHTYCLIDDKRIFNSRCLDSGQAKAPSCSSMDDNYYVRMSAFIDEYSPEAVGAAAEYALSASKNEVELMFSDENVYKEAKEGLFENSELWGISDNITFSESVYYSMNDEMYVIKIKF